MPGPHDPTMHVQGLNVSTICVTNVSRSEKTLTNQSIVSAHMYLTTTVVPQLAIFLYNRLNSFSTSLHALPSLSRSLQSLYKLNMLQCGSSKQAGEQVWVCVRVQVCVSVYVCMSLGLSMVRPWAGVVEVYSASYVCEQRREEKEREKETEKDRT